MSFLHVFLFVPVLTAINNCIVLVVQPFGVNLLVVKCSTKKFDIDNSAETPEEDDYGSNDFFSRFLKIHSCLSREKRLSNNVSKRSREGLLGQSGQFKGIHSKLSSQLRLEQVLVNWSYFV